MSGIGNHSSFSTLGPYTTYENCQAAGVLLQEMFKVERIWFYFQCMSVQ